MGRNHRLATVGAGAFALMCTTTTTAAQELPSPAAEPAARETIDRLRDRGEGVPSSMFGTYIRHRQLTVYPYYEYYRDKDFEYKPSELGSVGEVDFRGRYRAHEWLFFVGYGLTPDIALEFEVAAISATLDKAATDSSSLPLQVRESGLGDIETQFRWRWWRETDIRPEIFSFVEAVVPHHQSKALIGTPGWELKYGMGLVRGYSWGTLAARISYQFEEESDSHFGLGEYAIEYLRRLSPSFRIYAGVEGTDDEVELIPELQWHINPQAFIKFNSAFGLTSKAIDWAPEVGIVFQFGGR